MAITRLSQLPRELSTRSLEPLADPGEPRVALQIHSVGNTSPYRFQGRTSRIFYFTWDRSRLCHLILIPLSIWQLDKLAIAREILDQNLFHPIVVDVIQSDVSKPQVSSSEVDALTLEKGELLTRVAELTETICNLKGEAVPLEVLELLARPTDTTQPQITPDSHPMSPLDTIKAALPIRLNALAESLNKNPEELRVIIESPDSGLVIKPAGWIGLKEEQ